MLDNSTQQRKGCRKLGGRHSAGELFELTGIISNDEPQLGGRLKEGFECIGIKMELKVGISSKSVHRFTKYSAFWLNTHTRPPYPSVLNINAVFESGFREHTLTDLGLRFQYH